MGPVFTTTGVPVSALFLLLSSGCQDHSIFQLLLLNFPRQESIDKTKYSVRLKNSSRSAFAHYEFLISIVYSKPKPKPNPRIGVMKNYHSTYEPREEKVFVCAATAAVLVR